VHWNESIWILFCAGLALKGAAILGIAWLITLMLRRRSAATRHLVWTSAFATLLVLPVLTIALPNLPVRMTSLPGVLIQATAVSSSEVKAVAASEKKMPAPPTPQISWRTDWSFSLLLLWGLGTAVSLLRTTAACAAVWRIRRTARPISVRNLRTLVNQLALRNRIEVFETATGTMPMSFGLLHPAISLPSDASDWEDQRRDLVLLHELAHVQRGDFAMNLIARTALSLHWWNPMAWIAWREFLKEQERATDDLVLNTGASAADYAGHLLEIARTMQTSDVAIAAVAMARRSQLEGRLLAILDGKINRQSLRRASAVYATLGALLVAVPLAMLRGQESHPQLPADVDATIRSAQAQRNHKIVDDAAKAEEAAQKYDIARKLVDTSLAISAEVSGQQSVEYGVGLIRIADLERRRGHIDDAVSFYTKATAVLGNHAEVAPALIFLGEMALRNKDLAQATDYFQRAKVVAPEKSSEATMWLAVTQERQGNIQEADALYQEALGAHPDAPHAATILRVYAQFLDRQGRGEDAKTMRDRELAMRKTSDVMDRIKASRGADVYRIGGGVTAPVPLSKTEPEYTEEARLAKLAGTAVIYAEIGPDGRAHNVAVVYGLGLGLDEKAVAAISQWTFNPGTKDGQPVTVQAMIEVNFRLL